MTKKTWRVAMIGAGGIVQWGHIPAFQKMENVEIVAICDVNGERAKTVAAEAGIPGVYTDYKVMLAEVKPDLAVVATPNVFHKPMTLAALEAGCHVLCEKPLAITYADALEVVERAEALGKVLTVGTHYRWSGAMQAAKHQVDAGFFGEIYAVRTVYSRRSGIPGYGSWFTNNDLAGGGSLFDIGVHGLDKALYLMGYPKPLTVTGVTYAKFGPRGKGLGGWGIDKQKPTPGARYDVDDLALAFVRFENGATLQLQAAWASNMPDDQSVELFGTEGGARISGASDFQLFTEVNDAPVNMVQPVPQDKTGSNTKQISDLIQYLDGDADAPLVTGRQILVGVQILDAIYKSAASGREVVLG